MPDPPSQRSNSISRATLPKWRSSLSSPKKQKPAASVSIVFAQPEPGARLGSAIDRLPVVGVDDAASIYSTSSRKRERLNSSASSFSQPDMWSERAGPQIGQRERDVAQRKRSKLNLDVSDDPQNVDGRTVENNVLSAEAPGSATNPVDLTESPKPMDISLDPPPAQLDETKSEGVQPQDDPQAQSHNQSPSQLQEGEAVPFPTADAQKTDPSSKSTPARSSWFIFSRTKANDVSDSTPAQPSGTSAAPAVPSSNPASPSEPAASLAIPATQADQPKDVNVSNTGAETVDLSTLPPASSPPRDIPKPPPPSSSSSMGFSSVQYSPPTPTSAEYLRSNTTSISSVDEEVPTLCGSTATLTITPQAVMETQEAGMRGRKPSVSSLNPSTSRFTLRLPLLGRPKMPLEQAVASAQAESLDSKGETKTDDAEAATSGSVAASEDKGGVPVIEDGGSSTSAAPQAATNVNVNVIPPTPGLELSDPTRSQSEGEGQVMAEAGDDSTKDPNPRPASWWDYVGWGGAGHAHSDSEGGQNKPSEGTASQEASDSTDAKDDGADAHALQSAEQPSSSDVSHEAATDPQEQEEKLTPKPQDEPTAHDPLDANRTKKPTSILSSETARSHGPSWYSPWAWYHSSPTAPNGDAGVTHTSVEGSITPKTDAEMVKEQALARDQEQDAQTQTQAQPESKPVPATVAEEAPSPPPEPSNPIQSSIADNRSGWMSFLMSKTLTVKHVTDGTTDGKDDSMEVMEIDDEPDPDVAIEVDTQAKATAKDIPGVPKKKPSELRLSSSSKTSSSSPTSSASIPPKSPMSPTTKAPTKEKEKEHEPKKKSGQPPLTDSESVKRGARTPSPTPSAAGAPPSVAKPNFVLPTWADTFHAPPRSQPPPRAQGAKSGLLSYVAGALFSGESALGIGKGKGKGKGKAKAKGTEPHGRWSSSPSQEQQPQGEFVTFGQELPKALDVVEERLDAYVLEGGCRVVVIGVAGWSPGAVTRTLAGGFPSSSSKFVNMTVQALEQFSEEAGFKFKKITPMALEGDGTIRKKVSRVYNHLVENDEWMEDLHAADVIFVASHSQGAVVSAHLVDRLIEDGHILTSRSVDTLARSAAALAAGGAAAVPTAQAQRVCLLALCGIHLGPLRYLKTSSLLQPYVQYVENAAARELFEFQDTESNVSKNYIGALRNILDHGTKVVYIASLNDQVVPIYSGLFTAASHPRILRALYIDNDAYHSSDFLSNLLILLIRIRNAGLSDRGLLAHLSEATAGTLSGVGHSTAYEEPATYSLAVKYFFMTNHGSHSDSELVINTFNAVEEQNDYEIPWLLRDMIADDKISHFFAREFSQLRDAFADWQPKTTILRDVKKKLQPITRLSSATAPQTSSSISKL